MAVNRLDQNTKNKDKNTQTQTQSNPSETNQPQEVQSKALSSILNKKKEQKYRTSVYLKPEIFEKLITLNGETGESFTDIIETLLEEPLRDVAIKPRYVTAYKEKLKKKQSGTKNPQNQDEDK